MYQSPEHCIMCSQDQMLSGGRELHWTCFFTEGRCLYLKSIYSLNVLLFKFSQCLPVPLGIRITKCLAYSHGILHNTASSLNSKKRKVDSTAHDIALLFYVPDNLKVTLLAKQWSGLPEHQLSEAAS